MKIYESDDGRLELWYCEKCNYKLWAAYPKPPAWVRVLGSILIGIALGAGIIGGFALVAFILLWLM